MDQENALPIKAEVAKLRIYRLGPEGTMGEEIQDKDLKKDDAFVTVNPDGTPHDGKIMHALADAFLTIDAQTQEEQWGVRVEWRGKTIGTTEDGSGIIDTGKSPVERVQDLMREQGLEIKELSTREIERVLGDVELAKIAVQMAYHIREESRIEDEKKEVTARLKKVQDGHTATLRVLAEKYEEKKEVGPRLLVVGIDSRLMLRRLFDAETGIEVMQEPLERGDLQQEMFPKDEIAAKRKSKAKAAQETAQEPAAPTGPMEIGFEAPKANKHGVESEEGHIHSSVVNEAMAGIENELETAARPEPKPKRKTISVSGMQSVTENMAIVAVAIKDAAENTYFARGSLIDKLDMMQQSDIPMAFLDVTVTDTDEPTKFEVVDLEVSAYTGAMSDEAERKVNEQTPVGDTRHGGFEEVDDEHDPDDQVD